MAKVDRRCAKAMLPNGMTFEWTDLTYQQVTPGQRRRCYVFPLCVLLVFLVLAALYESWSLPLAVILIVPMALLAAMGGIWLVNLVHGCRWRSSRRRARRRSSTTTSSRRSAWSC